MAEQANLTPGKFFPKELRAPTGDDIRALLADYGSAGEQIRLIDTSFSETDVRLHYIVDNKWVLRLCRAAVLYLDCARRGLAAGLFLPRGT
ncbi:MAG: hypothetical protein IJP98_06645 [Clostridia bacterium]|nr:hypothetical protein [Clostridia bacterium]